VCVLWGGGVQGCTPSLPAKHTPAACQAQALLAGVRLGQALEQRSRPWAAYFTAGGQAGPAPAPAQPLPQRPPLGPHLDAELAHDVLLAVPLLLRQRGAAAAQHAAVLLEPLAQGADHLPHKAQQLRPHLRRGGGRSDDTPAFLVGFALLRHLHLARGGHWQARQRTCVANSAKLQGRDSLRAMAPVAGAAMTPTVCGPPSAAPSLLPLQMLQPP
jgi:hypothetical protein